uniref:Putative secreted protein n=1 Tax=Anopheles darlingi TaxID=43151 RepID=A0A2M4DK45_ANODA
MHVLLVLLQLALILAVLLHVLGVGMLLLFRRLSVLRLLNVLLVGRILMLIRRISLLIVTPLLDRRGRRSGQFRIDFRRFRRFHRFRCTLLHGLEMRELAGPVRS